ncbi:hypothetical protein JTB14_001262 [Gonioctena quinquepunctata]|nr:hypothetical protein JTB14_001262 [Gonioctena quinquepunctata]
MMIKERDAASAEFKRTKAPVDWSRYKELRNFTLSSIRREKRAYHDSIFYSRDSKQLWSALNEINPKKNNTDLPTNLQKPEQINNYSSSVFIDKEVDDDLLNYYNTGKFPQLKNHGSPFKIHFISVMEVREIMLTHPESPNIKKSHCLGSICTALFHHMDQNAIRLTELFFRKRLLDHISSDNKEDVVQSLEDINLKDAVCLL